MHGVLILSGVVGSTAYGLAHAESDVDRLGVYAAPAQDFYGLHMPPETYVCHDPDITYHELAKFCRLALRCNPTILELLWLNEYETVLPAGEELIYLRRSFLSAPLVRGAYLGYARQQFERMERRGNGTFSSDTARRTAKHARHLFRLLIQGKQLYTQGTLHIRLSGREAMMVRDFGEEIAEQGDLAPARALLDQYTRMFDESGTQLPERPDATAVDTWLRATRVALEHT